MLALLHAVTAAFQRISVIPAQPFSYHFASIFRFKTATKNHVLIFMNYKYFSLLFSVYL